jgi:hypothetical protein
VLARNAAPVRSRSKPPLRHVAGARADGEVVRLETADPDRSRVRPQETEEAGEGVVFPAPFGPISPTVSPRRTSSKRRPERVSGGPDGRRSSKRRKRRSCRATEAISCPLSAVRWNETGPPDRSETRTGAFREYVLDSGAFFTTIR